ncbi:hypothetical protein MKX01_040634, partial [Papaver californicum]
MEHANCYPRAFENQFREEELDPLMLRVHSIFIGFAMMSIMRKPEFMNRTNLYGMLP